MNLAKDGYHTVRDCPDMGREIDGAGSMLGAFLLAGIVAAALSSASTFLSLVGFSVSNDMGSKPLALTVNTTRKNHVVYQSDRAGLLLLFSTQHFLVHAIHRNRFRVQLGSGGPDEHLEQTYHKRCGLSGA